MGTTHGDNHPCRIPDTSLSVWRQDEARYGGRFRTRDLILAYTRAYAAGHLDAWVKA